MLYLFRAPLRGLCRILRACAVRVLLDGLPLVERAPPRVDAHSVQRVVCPFDDMERIEAPYGVRAMVVDAVRYPPRTVASHDDDGRALLRREHRKELVQNLLPVPLAGPYHGVGVVVDHGRYVAVAFLVAGFVYAYAHKAVETLRDVGLKVFPDEVRKPSDGLPVDPHPLRDAFPAESALNHPRRRVGEVQREPRAVLRPRNCGSEDAVPAAADPRHVCAEPHHDGAEVNAAPEALFRQVVVHVASPPADGASPAVFLLHMDMHRQRGLAAVAFGELRAVDGRPLDIEQRL